MRSGAPTQRTTVTTLLSAVVLVGCSAGAPKSTPAPGPSAGGSTAGPRAGGTLRVVVPAGPTGLGHLDPALAGTPAERELLSVTSRQLVAYPSSESLAARQDPVADVSLFPDPSDDKTSYSFRLRDVRWPAPIDRAVRATDVIYGVKRLCWPGRPSPALPLLERDIVGLTDFCAGLAAAAPTGQPGQVRSWLDSHEIAGLRARDVTTVTIAVQHPVGDFLNTLALPEVAPLPEEAVGDDVPDSPSLRAHLPALGPYRYPVAGSGADAGALVLERNPAWQPETDPLRRAYPDHIVVRTVSDAAAAAGEVTAGRADLVLGGLDPQVVARAVAHPATDPMVRATAQASLAYLLVAAPTNTCGRAFADERLRRALGLGLDRGALAAADGAPLLARPAGGLLPPGVLGSDGATSRPADPFATPGQGGDPAVARSLLAAARPAVRASRPLRCTLSITAPELAPLARALIGQAATLGIRLEQVGSSRRGDLTLRRFTAPWHGNAARGLLASLLVRCAKPGCYAGPPGSTEASSAATAAVEEAQAENDPNIAAARWADAAALVLATAPVVPLVTGRRLSLAGQRVSAFRWSNLSGDADLATVAVRAR